MKTKVRVNKDGVYVKTIKFTPAKVDKFPSLERLSRKIHNKILKQYGNNA